MLKADDLLGLEASESFFGSRNRRHEDDEEEIKVQKSGSIKVEDEDDSELESALNRARR